MSTLTTIPPDTVLTIDLSEIDEILETGKVTEAQFRKFQKSAHVIRFTKTRFSYGKGLYLLQKEAEFGDDEKGFQSWMNLKVPTEKETAKKYMKLAERINELRKAQPDKPLSEILNCTMSKILKPPPSPPKPLAEAVEEEEKPVQYVRMGLEPDTTVDESSQDELDEPEESVDESPQIEELNTQLEETSTQLEAKTSECNNLKKAAEIYRDRCETLKLTVKKLNETIEISQDSITLRRLVDKIKEQKEALQERDEQIKTLHARNSKPEFEQIPASTDPQDILEACLD